MLYVEVWVVATCCRILSQYFTALKWPSVVTGLVLPVMEMPSHTLRLLFNAVISVMFSKLSNDTIFNANDKVAPKI